MSSTGVHAGAAVVLPGSMQATASGTVSLPGTVTVRASAVADLGNGTMLPLSVSGLAAMDDFVTMNTINTNDGRPRAGPRFDRTNRTHVNDSTDIAPRLNNPNRHDAGRNRVPRFNNRAFEQNVQPNARGNGRVSSQSERSRNSANVEVTSASKWNIVKDKLRHFTLTNFAKYYYGPWLQKMSAKVCIIIL